MYSLDYETISQVLRQFRYSGTVSSHVPAHTAIGESGYIILAVEGGTVTSCVILNEHGQNLYSDAEAYRLLPQLGVLEWNPTLPSAPQFGKPTLPSAPQFGKPTLPSVPRLGKPTLPSAPRLGKPTLPSAPRLGKPTLPSAPQFGKPMLPSAPQFGKPMLPSAPQFGKPMPPFPVVPSSGIGNHTLFQHLEVPKEQISTWSMLDRSIYFLCDGMHTSEQIRVLLSRPRHVIEQVLQNLLKRGVVRQL